MIFILQFSTIKIFKIVDTFIKILNRVRRLYWWHLLREMNFKYSVNIFKSSSGKNGQMILVYDVG